ncbi:YvrJ family protein [Phascolarctobacterium faecium]|nr:YvrJ family protein [Phascolarctobacterium faecium]
MDTKEIFSAVGNFGFPMVLSWYLLLRMEQFFFSFFRLS